MRLIIPFLGKRKVDDDGFWKDVEELRQMTGKSTGGTNWVTGAPKPGEKIPEIPGALTTNKISPKKPGGK